MKKLKRLFLWLALLNKRMLKKASFLVILCCIPLLVIGVNLMSKQESGVLKVVLCAEDSEDELAKESIQKLMSDKSIIHFQEVTSVEEAHQLVQGGKADAAWIFPEDFKKKLESFLNDAYSEEGVIKIIEKEDNVALHLSREIFFGELYSTVSYIVYEHFVTEELLAEEEITKEELLENYQRIKNDESMFVFSYLDGEKADVTTSYMLYPIRGLLALVVVLCGMALGLYFMQDEASRVFTWMPLNKYTWGSWLYFWPGLLDICVAVLLGMMFSGVFTKVIPEVALMLIYLFMVIGFSDIVRRLCRKPVVLGAMIPLLILTMLALCPVFMGAPNVRFIQLLLPPFYYLNALHNTSYQAYMILYVIVVYFLDALILYIQKRKRWEES